MKPDTYSIDETLFWGHLLNMYFFKLYNMKEAFFN